MSDQGLMPWGNSRKWCRIFILVIVPDGQGSWSVQMLNPSSLERRVLIPQHFQTITSTVRESPQTNECRQRWWEVKLAWLRGQGQGQGTDWARTPSATAVHNRAYGPPCPSAGPQLSGRNATSVVRASEFLTKTRNPEFLWNLLIHSCWWWFQMFKKHSRN